MEPLQAVKFFVNIYCRSKKFGSNIAFLTKTTKIEFQTRMMLNIKIV